MHATLSYACCMRLNSSMFALTLQINFSMQEFLYTQNIVCNPHTIFHSLELVLCPLTFTILELILRLQSNFTLQIIQASCSSLSQAHHEFNKGSMLTHSDQHSHSEFQSLPKPQWLLQVLYVANKYTQSYCSLLKLLKHIMHNI